MWGNRNEDARDSGYPDDWNQRRAKVFRRDNWTCQSCLRKGGRTGSAELHAHHIILKSEGGTHDLENLTTVCDRCHAEIHDDNRLLADPNTSTPPWKIHTIVAAATGWWTFGIGNLLYEGYRRTSSTTDGFHQKHRKEGVRRLREEARNRKRTKNTESKGRQHKEVEAEYNNEFGGCQSCGRKSLAIRWEPRGNRRTKVIECQYCDSQYEENVSNGDIRLQPIEEDTQPAPVQSALKYELEKHLKLGTVTQSSLSDLKQELLQEADTEKERTHIESTFKEYEE